MVSRISIIGPPGTGKTRRFVQEIKDKLFESVATSVTLTPIYEIAKRSGFEAKTFGLRTIYGLAQSNLMKEGYLDQTRAKYLIPIINTALKKKVAKQLGLQFLGKSPYEVDVIESGTFEALTVLYTKAIFLKGDYNAVYDFLNEAEMYGITEHHLNTIYKLYKEGKYYDYAFLILDAWKHQVNIAKYIQGKDTIYFKYVYVDEAQDLGVIPYKLFELYEDQYEEFKLFGDPAQTIYQFLGAKPIVMLKHGDREILNPTHRFGKNIATLGNYLLKKLDFPYKIEYTEDKKDAVKEYTFRPEILRYLIKEIIKKRPDWTIAILTRTNRQASYIRKIISQIVVPLPIKESQKSVLERVFTAVRDFVYYKKTNDVKALERIRKYFGEEYGGILKYLAPKDYKDLSVTDFMLYVEKKLLGRRVSWVEEAVTRMLSGQKSVFVDTIHSAKGLEFDVVMVYDEIPSIISKTILVDRATYINEMFVYYTAITRAKKLLILLEKTNGYTNLFL